MARIEFQCDMTWCTRRIDSRPREHFDSFDLSEALNPTPVVRAPAVAAATGINLIGNWRVLAECPLTPIDRTRRWWKKKPTERTFGSYDTFILVSFDRSIDLNILGIPFN